MIDIRRSTASDKRQILAFADKAFGDEVAPGGFAALVPKLYGERAACEGNHLLLLEEGRLQALLLVEPVTYRVGDKTLQAACIGTVSVAAEARGKGYMKLLLEEAVKLLKEEQYDMALLGGQRQRYAYWGFEPCGIQTSCDITEDNLRHAYGAEEGRTLTLQKLNRDSALLGQAWELWNGQAVRIDRDKEAFYDILCSWHAVPYVLMEEDEVKAYTALLQKGKTVQIAELVTAQDVSLRTVMQTLRKNFQAAEWKLTFPAYSQDILRQAEDICQTACTEWNHQYRILNWGRVLEAFLQAKASYRPLKEGELAIRMEEEDGTQHRLNIRVSREYGAEVRKASDIQEAAEPSLVKLTAKEAVRHLFSSSQTVCPMPEDAPEGWFPLPLFITLQDCC